MTQRKVDMGRRTDDERDRDKPFIARNYLEGKTIRAIAVLISEDPERDYTVSHTTVGNDLMEIREDWRNSALVDMNAKIGEELAKIDLVELRAWEGYERSIGESVTTTTEAQTLGVQQQEEGDQGKQKQKLVKGKKTSQVKQLNGDPRFLKIIMDCVERRCKLLGLDAPEKREHVIHPIQEREPMTEEEWAAKLRRNEELLIGNTAGTTG